VPEVIESRIGFGDLWDTYQGWWTVGRKPVITMIEGAPPYQIGYGYGYEPMNVIPPGALEFGRTLYRNMRFGLGVALMNDGYYAYEFGDTFHGNDWWYDEFDADLGAACGPAARVPGLGPSASEHVRDGGFESTLSTNWSLWADSSTGAAAAVAADTTGPGAGTKSARVDISNAGDGTDWKILLSQSGLSIVKQTSYDLTFMARTSVPWQLGVNLQKGASDWRNYGLSRTVAVGAAWQTFTITFEANETASDARLGFELGAAAGSVWIDGVSVLDHPTDIFRRDFERGAVLLNGSRSPQVVTVAAGLQRLSGSQAPRYQVIVDDGDAAFTAGAGFTSAVHDSGLWIAAGPYFHDWAGGQSRTGKWQRHRRMGSGLARRRHVHVLGLVGRRARGHGLQQVRRLRGGRRRQRGRQQDARRELGRRFLASHRHPRAQGRGQTAGARAQRRHRPSGGGRHSPGVSSPLERRQRNE
jgi:hypothetical protein